MEIELQGSAEELETLQKELADRFPGDALQFSTMGAATPKFGARVPLGEGITLSLVLTVAVTTLTTEVVKDIYELIKRKYVGIQAKSLGNGTS